MDKLTLEITTDQAAAMARMLDLAIRIHLCQFFEIENLARGDIKHRDGRHLTFDELNALKYHLASVSAVFGFGATSSFGIYSQHVNKDAKRGYELKKVLEKALAEWHEPNPKGMRGVDYDGLICRFTDDPAPVAVVKRED